MVIGTTAIPTGARREQNAWLFQYFSRLEDRFVRDDAAGRASGSEILLRLMSLMRNRPECRCGGAFR